MFNSIHRHMTQLMKVMIPILIAQTSVVGMNFINTAMSGHAGADDLAGVSVGAGLCYPPLAASVGLLMAGTPMLAQLKGRKDRGGNIPMVVRTGLQLGLIVGLTFICSYFLFINSLMASLNLTPSVEHVARGYLLFMMGAVFFEALVIPLRALTDTIGNTAISAGTTYQCLLQLPPYLWTFWTSKIRRYRLRYCQHAYLPSTVSAVLPHCVDRFPFSGQKDFLRISY